MGTPAVSYKWRIQKKGEINMAQKFTKLTRTNIRKLPQGERVMEHGIVFERLPNGDGRYSVNVMVDGQRVHRTLGKESEGVTRQQAEDFISQARTDAREGRLQSALPATPAVETLTRVVTPLPSSKMPSSSGSRSWTKTSRIPESSPDTRLLESLQ